MGTTIGSSDSSKVMFMDPRTIPATIEGMRSLVSDGNNLNSQSLNFDLDKLER
jgi:hypothetical protein